MRAVYSSPKAHPLATNALFPYTLATGSRRESSLCKAGIVGISKVRSYILNTKSIVLNLKFIVSDTKSIISKGPGESRWGYTAATTIDWNGDGMVDLVSSDNSARTSVYMRYRTASGELALRPGVALKLSGLELHGTWRNGPACASLDGEMALVTSDEQDEAHLYFRIDDHNLRDGGKLLVRTHAGALENIQTNYLHAGGSGRLKYAWADWDHDRKLDLLLGTSGYHSIPNNLTGLPACSRNGGNSTFQGGKCGNNGATVLLMRQSGWSGSRQLVFDWPEWVTVRGKRISFGGQELGVAPYDSGDGRVSLMLATPGGRHVFWSGSDISTSTSEPPLQPPPRQKSDDLPTEIPKKPLRLSDSSLNEPWLLMDLLDVDNTTWGLVIPTASTVQPVPPSAHAPRPPAAAYTSGSQVLAVFPPWPAPPTGRPVVFDVYVSNATGWEPILSGDGDVTAGPVPPPPVENHTVQLLRYRTQEFVSYSPPQSVLRLTNLKTEEGNTVLKSIARNEWTGLMVMMVDLPGKKVHVELDGSRVGDRLGGSYGTMRSKDAGASWQLLSCSTGCIHKPDKDDLNVLFDTKAREFVDLQIMWRMNLTMKYCDGNVQGE